MVKNGKMQSIELVKNGQQCNGKIALMIQRLQILGTAKNGKNVNELREF